MINANELRIGNWVMNRNMEWKRVGEILNNAGAYSIHFKENYKRGGDYASDLTPIPLTEQILLGLGFKDNGTRLIGSNEIIEWEIESDGKIEKQFGSLEYVLCSNEWGSIQKSITVKYVHQLQNLHFSITGEELTYNPTT